MPNERNVQILFSRPPPHLLAGRFGWAFGNLVLRIPHVCFIRSNAFSIRGHFCWFSWQLACPACIGVQAIELGHEKHGIVHILRMAQRVVL